MGDNRSDPASVVASEIMRYLESHPDASDSLLGIRDWWLKRHPLLEGLDVLNEALERLVRAVVLERVSLPGGEYIFRVPKGSDRSNAQTPPM